MKNYTLAELYNVFNNELKDSARIRLYTVWYHKDKTNNACRSFKTPEDVEKFITNIYEKAFSIDSIYNYTGKKIIKNIKIGG